ncbi:MAG: PAS domain-containing protein, partial [Haloplanus sp.]
MATSVEFVVFSLVPGVTLVLAIAYSLVSIRRLDDYRPLILVVLLSLMATHQGTELVRYSGGDLSVDRLGEVVDETAANLLTGLTSYFLLGFLSEQQRMSERLRARTRDLRRMSRAIDASGHAVYITDEDGRIDYVNPAFEELTGYAAEEVLGERPDVLRLDGAGDSDDQPGSADERVYRR